jgi:lysophospholipase L1-like esterase
MRARGTLLNALVLVLSVIVTLGMLEVIIRIFLPQPLSPLLHTSDKVLGIRQIPGVKGRLRSSEFDTRVATNSRGLRDVEHTYSKPPGTRRMLCLGDSFTFGYGVEADQTFPKVMEKLLNDRPGLTEPWEVVNAGVPGTGTAYELAYFITEGYKYEPDFVLVAVCGMNDFSDNLRSKLYSFENGRLTKPERQVGGYGRLRLFFQRLPGYRFVFSRSHLMTLVNRRVIVPIFAGRGRPQADPVLVQTRLEAAYELTEQIFLAFRDACESRNCALVVTVVPNLDISGVTQQVSDLAEFLKSRNIPYVDLFPRFIEENAHGGQTLYLLDHHLTVAGNRLAAEVLSDYFAGYQSPAN